MTESLFNIRKEHLDRGLRGVPVGHCTTSAVSPEKGVSYRGYYVNQLQDKSPEEVMYLVYYGELPTSEQLKEFQVVLIEKSKVSSSVLDNLKHLPKKGQPMKWFSAGINLLGMEYSTGNYVEDNFNLIAKLPTIVATIFRLRENLPLIEPNTELGYIENFCHMLGSLNDEKFVRVMRLFYILHIDHGGGNLSTFVGKAVASGLEDLYGSLVGAMNALAGPLHGKANQECLSFLKMVQSKVSDVENKEELKKVLQDHFDNGGKIFGFGHAVLRVEDPRATIQYLLGQEILKDSPLFKLALNLREVGVEFLKQFPKISNPYPNVDAVSGVLLDSIGLKDDTYYTVLFGFSRCMGIAAQIVYERTMANNGKGTPIIRPKYLYSGPQR